jgi:hypothetical protein
MLSAPPEARASETALSSTSFASNCRAICAARLTASFAVGDPSVPTATVEIIGASIHQTASHG